MYDTKLIDWEHDRIDDVEVIHNETKHLCDVSVVVSIEEVVGNQSTLQGEVLRLSSNLATGLQKITYGGLEVNYKKIGSSVFEYYEGTVTLSKIQSGIKPKRGKFSKILNLLKVPQSLIKSIMTEYNVGSKEYSLHTSNNFYNHYRQMERKGIVKSCMSKIPNKFKVRLDTRKGEVNFNPLVAYEADKNWDLLLLKDKTREGYNYVARAVYNKEIKGFNKPYGQVEVFERVVEKAKELGLGIESKDFDDTTLEILETIDGDIVLPYVDGSNDAERYGEKLFLGSGVLRTQHNTGVASEGWYCEYCQEIHDVEEDMYIFNDESYCELALGEVFVCDNTGFLQDVDQVVFIENLGYYVHIDEVVEVVISGTDETEYALKDDGIFCKSDGRYYYPGDIRIVEIGCEYYLIEEVDYCEETEEYTLPESNRSSYEQRRDRKD